MTTACDATDAQLVSRVLDGEREVYGDLVRRHQDALYRHARGMGLDHDTSLDIVQDAFVRAYERLVECRDRTHFRAWAFRICRNLCLDYLKNIRRTTTPFSALPDHFDIAAHAEYEYDSDVSLRQALDHLPVALREAFLLKHLAGYSYDEIAVLTGTSVSAAKMRVHRARETLRALLL